MKIDKDNLFRFTFKYYCIQVVLDCYLSFQLLHEAINKYGDVGTVWTRIASYVQSRTSTQCRERWRTVVQGKNLLRPWTDVETNRTIEYGRMQLEKGRN